MRTLATEMTAMSYTQASMNFIADLPLYKTEKPYNCQAKQLPGGEVSNLVFETRTGVPVQDVRGSEHDFTLQEHGFTFIDHDSTVKGDVGSTEFLYAYLEETVDLIRNLYNTDKVTCYDLRVSPL